VSNVAVLFPGQGAQSVGMARDVAQAFSAAGEVFRQANEALGLELDAICFEGPQQKLDRTDICQPAILASSVAVLRAIEQVVGPLKGLDVVGSAGLSLGEYTALVAAGALEFEDGLRLVQRRGQCMQQACELRAGTMYSILGLEDDVVEDACAEARQKAAGGVWPANYNCPGQLVISGEQSAAALAAELCRDRGARRVVELNVGGAFHSGLMQPAAEKLAPELDQSDFKEPVFPVVANVTARPVRATREIRALLSRQITSPVRWADSMRYLIGLGAEEFYEIGPGRVLCGLLRRIAPALRCTPVGTAQAVRAAAVKLKDAARHQA